MSVLYNKKNKEQLIEKLESETFSRTTLSFYKYVYLENLLELRDKLYGSWQELEILGRIYIAEEGINAQISVPTHNLEKFKKNLYSYKQFDGTPFKKAIEDEKKSFYKLIIKVKKEIVAYGISKNDYESEVGKFDTAICPDVDTSKELLPETKKILEDHKDDNIMLYCTGGIRCEKASSYLIKNKFKNVFQLKGGIINYAKEIKEQNLKSKFKGKNFVFDDRLGERITDDILSTCHQCPDECDDHTNCENDACHILFIQCKKCKNNFNGCCSKECKKIKSMPIEEQRELRKKEPEIAAPLIHHYRDRLKPKLNEMISKKERNENE